MSKKEDIKKQVETLEKEIDDIKKKDSREKELVSTLQRLQAEFENFKKRTDKEKSDFTKFATSNIISKLLPILDNFDLAMQNKENKDEFISGIDMIYEQLMQTLYDAGLTKICALGKEFDPYVHEALLQEESDKDNTILQELQSGYMLGDKLLRPTKVKIGKIKKGE